MEWLIERNLVCPSTGAAFAVISSYRNLRIILWYKSHYFLRPGGEVIVSDLGIVVNGNIRDISLLHAFPFNENLWQTFEKSLDCPGNKDPALHHCDRKDTCPFDMCPYGVHVHAI